MLRTTLANVRAHKGRMLLSSVAIVLGTAFVAGTFVFTDAMRTALTSRFGEDLGRADVVVTAHGKEDVPRELLADVRQAGGVRYAHGRAEGLVALRGSGGRLEPANVVSVAANPALGWPTVTVGQLPDRRGEAVLDRATAKRSRISIGDTVKVGWDLADSSPHQTQALRIVGLVDPGDSPRYGGRSFVGVSPQQTQALPDDSGFGMILAVGADGVGAEQLAGRIGNAVDSGYEVRTGEEHTRAQVSSGGTTSVAAVLLAFAGVALFVAAIVIANTFSILLAQRTREMALLRCVGATRGQVFRSVLAESALLGIAASVAGVATGFGLAYGIGAGLDAWFDTFPFAAVTLSTTAVVVPIVVGVAVTVGAAVAPARAATRIPPVAALGEQGVPTRRAGWVRLLLAAVALLGGAAGLTLGTTTLSEQQGFAAVFAGGASAFLGVLLAAPVLVPPLVRLVGAVLGWALGTPGRLAAINAVRNPRRAAATTAALLVGVTLISVMSVGAASTRATVNAQLDEMFPVDYQIESKAGVSASVVDDVRGVPGLSDTTVVRGTYTRLQGQQVWVSGYDPQKLAQVTSQLPQLSRLDTGEAVLTEPLARRLGVGPGDTVRFGSSAGKVATITVSSIYAGQGPVAVWTTQRDLARIAPDAPTAAVYARATPGADLTQVSTALDRATAGHDVNISGTAKMRATYTSTIDTVLLVTTALLAVAMLIAIVGIANTLALSVIERTRESGLLRALGLTRGQLRATLAVEAGLLALVGVLLGLGLGIVFGWAAIASMLGSSFDVVLAVPGMRLAGLTAVAVAAALLASVLPARRAARAAVVSALADE